MAQEYRKIPKDKGSGKSS